MSETLYERIMNTKDTEKMIYAYAGDLQEILVHLEGKTKTVSEVNGNTILRLRSQVAELKKIGKRLLVPYSFVDDNSMMSTYCNYCSATGKFNRETWMWELLHTDNCAITKWRQLLKKIEEEG